MNELLKSHPAAKWNINSATVAEVTCDGKSDTVILGSEKGNVVVGVAPGALPHATQVFSFPIRPDMRANGAPGVFSVDNQLKIVKS